ncbi:hypothetical protein D3C87_1612530 [compost metagenome]
MTPLAARVNAKDAFAEPSKVVEPVASPLAAIVRAVAHFVAAPDVSDDAVPESRATGTVPDFRLEAFRFCCA